jgi:predicted GTPase
MQSVTLSVEQQNLFDYIEQSENNIFITGRAGTGKSTLLSYLVENTKKNVAVCAPTGVAALNVVELPFTHSLDSLLAFWPTKISHGT